MTDFRSLLSLAVVYAPTSFKEEEGEGGQQQKKLFRWLGVKPKPVIPFHSGLAVHRLKSRF